jgi:hypothetical protein
MELNKDNIDQWLKDLDVKAVEYFGYNFSECLTKEQWLEHSEGNTVDDEIWENIKACR